MAKHKDTSENKPEMARPDLDGLPTDQELDALQAQIDETLNETSESELSEAEKATKRIAELEMELAAAKDQTLRAMAEMQNVKKRSEREVKAASIYAVERFAADMLSVSDNLARALSVIDAKARDGLGENAKNLLDGIELTEKELIAVFARHGIKAVQGKGAKFDPNVHQAVAQIPSSEQKGDVAEVMQTGFTLGDRTLRAAMVAVSTGPAKA
ncbi:MAG TPA: nucleotide exchange factor GrpE [Hellea balneolensis]|uniref:Protein GrpE n=1 Tax=Hellea balneolensis TaxID=287478 RepID=A0A7C5R731_9PROT|nr:nucleotide exchange factor GrpE [Hellea balneolensis]